MDQYFIEDGVHRAVAARENGIKYLMARLHVDGSPPRLVLVSPSQLHSPKPVIKRFDRHSYDQLERAMATPAGRHRLPEIHVQPLGVFGQPGSVPLDQVVIEDF